MHNNEICQDNIETEDFIYRKTRNFLNNKGWTYFKKDKKIDDETELSEEEFNADIEKACDDYRKKEASKYRTEITIEPDGDGFYAHCPAFKGLHTCGATEEEALSNAKDAIGAYICSLIKHDEPIPKGVKKKREKEIRVELITQARLKITEPGKDPVAMVFNKEVEEVTIIDRQLKIEYRLPAGEGTQALSLPIDTVHEVKISML